MLKPFTAGLEFQWNNCNNYVFFAYVSVCYRWYVMRMDWGFGGRRRIRWCLWLSSCWRSCWRKFGATASRAEYPNADFLILSAEPVTSTNKPVIKGRFRSLSSSRFLDAASHLYKTMRVRPSVRRSVGYAFSKTIDNANCYVWNDSETQFMFIWHKLGILIIR